MVATERKTMGHSEEKTPGRSDTTPQQGDKQQRSPREPHERDESADSQAASEPSQERMGEIGRRDVERGVTETDQGPVLRDLHEKKIRP
jgi:hypothetical protein